MKTPTTLHPHYSKFSMFYLCFFGILWLNFHKKMSFLYSDRYFHRIIKNPLKKPWNCKFQGFLLRAFLLAKESYNTNIFALQKSLRSMVNTLHWRDEDRIFLISRRNPSMIKSLQDCFFHKYVPERSRHCKPYDHIQSQYIEGIGSEEKNQHQREMPKKDQP